MSIRGIMKINLAGEKQDYEIVAYDKVRQFELDKRMGWFSEQQTRFSKLVEVVKRDAP